MESDERFTVEMKDKRRLKSVNEVKKDTFLHCFHYPDNKILFALWEWE